MGTAKTVWDPLRRKNVALTPEEDVRQWFIMQLNRLMKVPLHMMMSEVALSIGGKRLRADIVVYGRDASPAAVVECKRPDIPLDKTVLDQAVVYNMVLNVRYIFITNGTSTYVCRRQDGDDHGAEICARGGGGHRRVFRLPYAGTFVGDRIGHFV